MAIKSNRFYMPHQLQSLPPWGRWRGLGAIGGYSAFIISIIISCNSGISPRPLPSTLPL